MKVVDGSDHLCQISEAQPDLSSDRRLCGCLDQSKLSNDSCFHAHFPHSLIDFLTLLSHTWIPSLNLSLLFCSASSPSANPPHISKSSTNLTAAFSHHPSSSPHVSAPFINARHAFTKCASVACDPSSACFRTKAQSRSSGGSKLVTYMGSGRGRFCAA